MANDDDGSSASCNVKSSSPKTVFLGKSEMVTADVYIYTVRWLNHPVETYAQCQVGSISLG